MRITEVITEAKDDSFAKEVGSDVSNTYKGLWADTKNIAKAAVDPDTYVKAGGNARDAIDRGIDFAKKDPRGALRHVGQTADDYVRATSNAWSFGLADKAQAKLNALTGIDTSDPFDIKPSTGDYEKELAKQYRDAADAEDRSPNATLAGKVSGTIANPAFGTGIRVGGAAAKTIAPKVVKALSSVPGKTASNIAKNVVKNPLALAAGISAEKAAQKAAQKVDPDNPYVDESIRLKELVKYRF
jgi:hypothetical protein